MNPNEIGFYESEYYFLSNFSAFAVEWKGKVWMTSEHAYQAAKFTDEDIQQEIFNTRSAHDAKKCAQSHKDNARSDWAEIKLSIMKDICRHKLQQNEYIQKKLIQSGDKVLIETSHKDAYWGWGPNKDGENHLGKIWMELREELK